MAELERVLFLSLRPAYSEHIMSGSKTIELRRIRPRAKPGSLAIIYASSPEMRVVGTCIVDEIGTATPQEIWRLHGPKIGIDWSAVADYFSGKEKGVAISLSRPERLDTPIPLQSVRLCVGASVPPQSFRYLSPAQATRLLKQGAPAASV
jgi:predicted transcriptional regulator